LAPTTTAESVISVQLSVLLQKKVSAPVVLADVKLVTWYATAAPAVRETLGVIEYAPPPPPPPLPEILAFVTPPAPAPITSIVLRAASQLSGTIHVPFSLDVPVVPVVRNMTVVVPVACVEDAGKESSDAKSAPTTIGIKNARRFLKRMFIYFTV
jgi:hypothetical protein